MPPKKSNLNNAWSREARRKRVERAHQSADQVATRNAAQRIRTAEGRAQKSQEQLKYSLPVSRDYWQKSETISKMERPQWSDEFMEKFAMVYIKYGPLHRKQHKQRIYAEKRQRKKCYVAMAEELGDAIRQAHLGELTLPRLCHIFCRNYTRMLMELWLCATSAGAAHESEGLSVEERVLAMAPPWVRLAEPVLRGLPHVHKSHALVARRLRYGEQGRNVTAMVGVLATQLARQVHARRTTDAEQLGATDARLLHRVVDGHTFKLIWERMRRVCLAKLRMLLCAGDDPLAVCDGVRMSRHDWHIANALLLYGDAPVLNQESHLLYEQLQPLIQVFHLVQAHAIEEPDHPEPLAQRWIRAHVDYASRGLTASLVLLQRRWCELKHCARESILTLWKKRDTKPVFPIHVAIVKRFPHVVMSPLPTWEEHVKNGEVILGPDDLMEELNPPAGTPHPLQDQENDDDPIDSEDDLILIERDIETVDLEDEEAAESDYESDEKLVIDEPQTEEDGPALGAIKKEDAFVEEEYPNAGLQGGGAKEPGDDDNDMQLDDTCVATPTILDDTKASSNDKEIFIADNDLTDTRESAQIDPNANEKVTENNETGLKTEEGKETHESIDQGVGCEKIGEKREAIEAEQIPNIKSEDSAAEANVGNEVHQTKDEKPPDKVVASEFTCTKEDSVIITQLAQLDPRKMQTMITFESDSDAEGSRDASPQPGCSGLQGSYRGSRENTPDPSDGAATEVLQDMKESPVNGRKSDIIVKWETKSDSGGGGGGGSPRLGRKRFLSAPGDDVDSESSDDELPIAELRKRKAKWTPPEEREASGSATPATAPGSEENSRDMSFSFGGKLRTVTERGFAAQKQPRLPGVLRCVWEQFRSCNAPGFAEAAPDGAEAEAEAEEAREKRVAKRVELPNIEEVRRINRNMLTAQVTPLTAPPEQGSRKKRNSSGANEDGGDATPGQPLPKDRELASFLEELTYASRLGTEQGLLMKGIRGKGAYCCLARRHRAVNDARRRLAAKAGHARPPPLITLHGGLHLKTCKCCCLHLVRELDRDEEVELMQRLLKKDIADMLAGKPLKTLHWNRLPEAEHRAPANRVAGGGQRSAKRKRRQKAAEASSTSSSSSEVDTDWEGAKVSDGEEGTVTTRITRSAALLSDSADGGHRAGEPSTPEAGTSAAGGGGAAPRAKPADDGYEEWERQKNLASRFFHIGGHKGHRADKTNDANSKSNSGDGAAAPAIDLVTDSDLAEETGAEESNHRIKSPALVPEARALVLQVKEEPLAASPLVNIKVTLDGKSTEEAPATSPAPPAPTPRAAPAGQAPPSAGHSIKWSGSLASFKAADGRVISGVITPSLRGLPSPVQGVTAGGGSRAAAASPASAAKPADVPANTQGGSKLVKIGAQFLPAGKLIPVVAVEVTDGACPGVHAAPRQPESLLRGAKASSSSAAAADTIEAAEAEECAEDEAKRLAIERKLAAAVRAAQLKLRHLKDFKSVKLTVELENDSPTVCIARSGGKRTAASASRRLPRAGGSPSRVAPLVHVVQVPSPALQLPRISAKTFLRGKDPSNVQLMCLDEARLNPLPGYLFLSECLYPVRNQVFCTIAPWRSVQRLHFGGSSEAGGGGAAAGPGGLSGLLKGADAPDHVTLGEKHYKKISDVPLVYAQVYSMVWEVRERRRLLMERRPLWTYATAGAGALRPIAITDIAPNNLGLMCDDHDAVKFLVTELNTLASAGGGSGAEGPQPPLPRPPPPPIQADTIIELDSD